MRYLSTRGLAPSVGFAEAVERGLAPDGGLYLPETLPDFSRELPDWERLTYPQLAARFLGYFVEPELAPRLPALAEAAYATFTEPDIAAPLRRLDERTWLLELFHGPTLAFKDFALRLLGQLYGVQIAATGHGINVLGATSGDTGSAAIWGLMDTPGTRLFILYPDGRVAALQERQMACTGRENVFPIAVDGTFDDAQKIVKTLFAEEGFRAQHHLAAINSINLARILSQCVYYVWAWLRLPPPVRHEVNFVVPTGNFGNVLAGWLAKQMGLPINGLTVATNQNDILWRLFTSGVYELGAVQPSLAPSMDIQVASNFERFLYYAEHCDPTRVREVMVTFQKTGRWAPATFATDIFAATRATDADIPRLIREVHDRYGVVVDPHTACGFADLPEGPCRVVLATAHPAKFPETIVATLGHEVTHPTLEALAARPVVRHRLPATVEAVRAFVASHSA